MIGSRGRRLPWDSVLPLDGDRVCEYIRFPRIEFGLEVRQEETRRTSENGSLLLDKV